MFFLDFIRVVFDMCSSIGCDLCCVFFSFVLSVYVCDAAALHNKRITRDQSDLAKFAANDSCTVKLH